MKTTLKKVLSELQKEHPDLSYIRGMLEVLIGEYADMMPVVSSEPEVIEKPIEQPPIDEASILDAKAKAHIERFGMPVQNV